MMNLEDIMEGKEGEKEGPRHQLSYEISRDAECQRPSHCILGGSQYPQLLIVTLEVILPLATL